MTDHLVCKDCQKTSDRANPHDYTERRCPHCGSHDLDAVIPDLPK